MHPFINDLSGLTDSEVENKIFEISKRYFMTQNTHVREQILTVLATYKEELDKRRAELWAKTIENKNKGLDKLIQIN
jgi:hypothetical protein